MNHINFRVDGTGEGDNDKLIIEGDKDALLQLKQRLSDVIEVEIEKTAVVAFDMAKQKITFNGRDVQIEVRKVNVIQKTHWWKQKDVFIAAGIVIICAVLVLYALIKSGNKG
jgi:hypothetical protein